MFPKRKQKGGAETRTKRTKKTGTRNSLNKKSSEKKTEKTKEDYTTYKFEDELLKKWMENARKQAVRNVYEMIIEFRDSSIIGFGLFFKSALMVIAIGAIFFVICLIITSI